MGYQIANEQVTAPGSVNSNGTETSDPVDISDQGGEGSMYWRASGDGTLNVTLQGTLDGGSNWFDLETISGTPVAKSKENGVLSTSEENNNVKVQKMRLKFEETGGSSQKSIDDVRASY